MKKLLTIYGNDDAELAFMHGTLLIKNGEQAAPKFTSFVPPDSKAVLIPFEGDAMAVMEQPPEQKRTTRKK